MATGAAEATGAAQAHGFFLGLCWDGEPHCPRCRNGRIYFLKQGRMRCGGCGYTFHHFSGRWINRGGLTADAWSALLELFAQGRCASRIAGRLPLSYNTVHKALTTVRLALVGSSPGWEGLLGPDNELLPACTGREAGHCSCPVFAVQGRDRVEVHPVARLHAGEVLGYPVAKNSWRSVVYTDRFNGWESLIFRGCRGLARNLAERTPVLLDAPHPFWRFARQWLAGYRSLSPDTFALYLKEAEFRYNNRDRDLFPLLARALCGFVPNLGQSKKRG